MKVEIKIEKNLKEPYAVIYTKEITSQINQIVLYMQAKNKVFPVSDGEKTRILKPEDIYLIKSEDNKLTIYDQKNQYTSNKRLYEVPQLLGNQFMRISKNTYININYLESVEVAFSGMLKMKLKNGLTDYISRMYVKELKNYLRI